jgi:hypothetical protein
MERRPRGGAQAGNIPGVCRYARLDQNDIQLQMFCPPEEESSSVIVTCATPLVNPKKIFLLKLSHRYTVIAGLE